MFNIVNLLLSILISSGNTSIMVDGFIGKEEWRESKEVFIDSENKILLKEDDTYLYLAIKSKKTKPLYIDMFVSLENSIVNFHASSQLGDRILTDTSWTDAEPETRWGYNKDWVANTVKFDRAKMKELREKNFEGSLMEEACMSYDGMEFQFNKASWPINNKKFRIEIRNMVGPDGFETISYPVGSLRKMPIDWKILQW